MSKSLNSWWLRRGEGGRFSSPAMELHNQLTQEQIERAYWRQMQDQAIARAKALLGKEEYNRRLDILWPEEEGNKSFEDATMIYREMVNSTRWESENV